ncbi:3-hydroxybenzoate 6-monooxygenase [Azospirillum sp. ST 5-10]|uniref:3-hydroxybenzoate 6-monooxygenase n=1 Tax=unclassified Azospirillum TaxID=2630922 RepID=UPI003F4A0538
MTDSPILIAGGGIGGLAAALGLARKGLSSVVLEQAAELGEIGAGIQIGPNAFHAFDYLGVGDAARSKAVYIDHLMLMDAVKDRRIAAIPLDEPFRRRFKNPYAVIHRADLHGVLLDACRADARVTLRTRAGVERYEQDGDAVTAILSGGERVAGRALIGADGLHSKVRAQLVGDGAPRVSGHTTFRSVIPTEQMPEDLRWNAATLWAGPKCHIVHYPLKGGKVYNLVVTFHSDATEPVAGQPVSQAEVAAGFSHVAERPRRILECADTWKKWVLCDRDPVAGWVDGRVALLGDAAHPMLQYLAQGACMALEDAVNLSHHVAESGGDLHAAFTTYNRERFIRTGRVQINSRLMGEYVYHPDAGRAALRDAILGSSTPEQHYDRIAWLYGVTGLGAAI